MRVLDMIPVTTDGPRTATDGVITAEILGALGRQLSHYLTEGWDTTDLLQQIRIEVGHARAGHRDTAPETWMP